MEKHHPPLATFFPGEAPSEADRRLDTKLLRYVANHAAFYLLCRQKRGCARAQRCRGNAAECVGRFTGLLPDDARAFIEAALEGRRADRPFDEIAEENPDALEALADWRDAVETAFGPLRDATSSAGARP